MSLAERVRDTVRHGLARAAAQGALGANGVAVVASATLTVERPKRPEHGDLATNAALALAKQVGMPPRAVAEVLVAALAGSDVVRAAEIAGPGFVNLRLHPAAFHAEVRAIRAAGRGYGRAPSATGERVNVEFVSANPTGPITVAAARNAVLGDGIATLLEATGCRVTREYYVNDFGNQVTLFADSVSAVAEGREVPEDGYKGEYVKDLVDAMRAEDPALLRGDRAELARAVTSRMLVGIKRSLAMLGVHHDVWFSEESLHRWGRVGMALATLRAGGWLVEKDGALFFVAKDEGADDKDRVVRKSDGVYTYFASDIAYHADKVLRGYDRLINVLGADHHGYVARVRNALGALGLPSDRFEAVLYQLVFLMRGGELVKSSKRAGNVLTSDEVIEEIDAGVRREGAGRDALRFFFLARAANSNVEFDIELAKKASVDNPVFYVQYGHARLSSILERAREIGLRPSVDDLEPLVHPDELGLAARISELPEVVAGAAATREPHKLVVFLETLAREFQSYFTRRKADDDPILPPASLRARPGWEATWDFRKTAARLAWIEAIRVVYGAALALLGVSAPDRMDREDGRDEP